MSWLVTGGQDIRPPSDSLGTGGLTFPCSFACWVKDSALSAGEYLAHFNTDNASNLNNSLACFTTSGSPNDFYSGAVTDGAGAAAFQAQNPVSNGTWTNLWVPVVFVFSGTSNTCTDVSVYVGSNADVTSASGSHNMGALIQFARFTERVAGGGGVSTDRYIAEIAIWSKALDTTEVQIYCDGTAASGVAAANLLMYWALKDDLTQTGGTRSVGTLTATGSLQGDHPSITSGPTEVASLPSGTVASDVDAGQRSNLSTSGHTVTAQAGDDRMTLVALLREGGAGTTFNFSTCSWGNQTGSLVSRADAAAAGNAPGTPTSREIAIYRFMESQIAAKTGDAIVVTQTDSGTTSGMIVLQLEGVDQTTPINTNAPREDYSDFATTNASNATVIVNTGGLGLCFVLWGNVTTATWSGGTELVDQSPFSSYTMTAAYTTSTGGQLMSATPAATATLSQTVAGLSVNHTGETATSAVRIIVAHYARQNDL